MRNFLHRYTGRQRILLFALLNILFLSITPISANPSNDILTSQVHEKTIDIDFFYHGQPLIIEGETDPGSSIIIKIESKSNSQLMKKKGKVAGFLWMNVGDIVFNNIPVFYQIHATGKLDDILGDKTRDHYIIGYKSLLNHSKITPVLDDKDKALWFYELVKLQESNGLFKITENKISVKEAPGDKVKYRLELDWPYQAMPDQYTIKKFSIKDGNIKSVESSIITVQQVGIVKSLTNMAQNMAALYGIISVAVAIVAGFLTALIFQKRGSK